jgi:CHASE1-domain containing sensor protein
MTIHAGPLLASLIDLESAAPFSSESSSALPLVLSLLGILLALLLSLRGD